MEILQYPFSLCVLCERERTRRSNIGRKGLGTWGRGEVIVMGEKMRVKLYFPLGAVGGCLGNSNWIADVGGFVIFLIASVG